MLLELLGSLSGSGGGTRTPDTRIMMQPLSTVNQGLAHQNSVNPATSNQILTRDLSNLAVTLKRLPCRISTAHIATSNRYLRLRSARHMIFMPGCRDPARKVREAMPGNKSLARNAKIAGGWLRFAKIIDL